MNQKKEYILYENVRNFISSIQQLNKGYVHKNEVIIQKYTCIVERDATRLVTHFEDWTTINDDIRYKNKVISIIQDNISKLHQNLLDMIKEQNELDGMLYYTYYLLSISKVL